MRGEIRSRDVVLTLLVLGPSLAAALWLGAPVAAGPVALGVGGMVGIELLLSRRAREVRRLWNRQSVQLLAVAGVLVTGAVLTVVAGAWVVTSLVSGLVAYLALLAAVWSRRRHRGGGEAND